MPISDSHLFGGGHIPPTIHDLAEAKRDFAMALPRAPARSRSTDLSTDQAPASKVVRTAALGVEAAEEAVLFLATDRGGGQAL